jgi:hypothetical protein
MRGNYHEVWIASVSDTLTVSFGEVDSINKFAAKVRHHKVYTKASRERLNRVIRDHSPTSTCVHPNGPSMTYHFRRGHKFYPRISRPPVLLARAA